MVLFSGEWSYCEGKRLVRTVDVRKSHYCSCLKVWELQWEELFLQLFFPSFVLSRETSENGFNHKRLDRQALLLFSLAYLVVLIPGGGP